MKFPISKLAGLRVSSGDISPHQFLLKSRHPDPHCQSISRFQHLPSCAPSSDIKLYVLSEPLYFCLFLLFCVHCLRPPLHVYTLDGRKLSHCPVKPEQCVLSVASLGSYFLLAFRVMCSRFFFERKTTKDPLNKTMGAGQVIRIPGELKAPSAIKTFCYLIKSTVSSRRLPSRLYDEFSYWMNRKWPVIN